MSARQEFVSMLVEEVNDCYEEVTRALEELQAALARSMQTLADRGPEALEEIEGIKALTAQRLQVETTGGASAYRALSMYLGSDEAANAALRRG